MDLEKLPIYTVTVLLDLKKPLSSKEQTREKVRRLARAVSDPPKKERTITFMEELKHDKSFKRKPKAENPFMTMRRLFCKIAKDVHPGTSTKVSKIVSAMWNFKNPFLHEYTELLACFGEIAQAEADSGSIAFDVNVALVRTELAESSNSKMPNVQYSEKVCKGFLTTGKIRFEPPLTRKRIEKPKPKLGSNIFSRGRCTKRSLPSYQKEFLIERLCTPFGLEVEDVFLYPERTNSPVLENFGVMNFGT